LDAALEMIRPILDGHLSAERRSDVRKPVLRLRLRRNHQGQQHGYQLRDDQPAKQQRPDLNDERRAAQRFGKKWPVHGNPRISNPGV
jgi:hypothetical protein